MAQAGVRLRPGARRSVACGAGLASLVILAASGAASARAPTLSARGVSPLLPAVHFVPGSLILPPPGPRPVLRDTCGATALSWLVGQPRSRIPIPTDLSRRRVSCSACVVAPDVRLDRLDILYDKATNLVNKVTCG